MEQMHISHNINITPTLSFIKTGIISNILLFTFILIGAMMFIMAENNIIRAEDMEYDIVINGGSFSSVAAALGAARSNPEAKILLLEPTDWLGGQATTQGVSAIDNAWHNPGATIMRENPPLYYPADYLEFLNTMKNLPFEAPGTGMSPNGTCWVSRESFDPRSGAWVLEEMIAKVPNITLMKMTVVKEVETTDTLDAFGSGKKIISLTLLQRTPIDGYKPFDKFLSEEILDWYDVNDSSIYKKNIYKVVARNKTTGMAVVDASELSDVIVLSGAKYTVGRELTTEKISEDGSLPAMDENGSQSYVFTFCMALSDSPSNEEYLKTPFTDFDTYLQNQKNTYFSLGSHTWNSVWSYRRLYSTGTPGDYYTINFEDISMQNWYPGNDYPYGTMLKNKAGAAAEIPDWKGGVNVDEIKKAEIHAVAWYFYMKEKNPTLWDTRMTTSTNSMNMMGTYCGLSKYPYIRCCRRIVGTHNFRMTERYFKNTLASDYNGKTSYRYHDSVGIANYAVDIHPTKISAGMSPSFSQAAPFYIPLRSLGSQNVRNLFAAGKSIGATYITNAAYRLHPIEWAIGSASGGAAGYMLKNNLTNYELLDSVNLRKLQTEIASNSPISWKAFDSEVLPKNNGDLIVNNLKQIVEGVPFDVEVYHNRANRADIYLNGALIGRTTTRANGRLVLTVPSAPQDSYKFKALCYVDDVYKDVITNYDESTTEIIDNADANFSISGKWNIGSSMPNKWGSNYHYSYFTDGPSTATWQLYIPIKAKYEISIWYPEAYNRATDSPFTVYHAGGATTFKINQQANGGKWLVLGIFEFDHEQGGKVVLSNDISDTQKLVVADAVKASQIRNPTQWLLIDKQENSKTNLAQGN